MYLLLLISSSSSCFMSCQRKISYVKETVLFILSISYLVREYAHIHLLNKNKNSSPKNNSSPKFLFVQENKNKIISQNIIIITIVYDHFLSILFEIFFSLFCRDHNTARNIIHLKPFSQFRKQDCRGKQHLIIKVYIPRCLAKK